MIQLEYARWIAFQRSNGFCNVSNGAPLIRQDGLKELETVTDVRIVDNPFSINSSWEMYDDVKRCIESTKDSFEKLFCYDTDKK